MPNPKPLLREIEGWRRFLVRELASCLEGEELSSTVGGIIDGVVFLRLAELQGIEWKTSLETLLQGPDAYGRLLQLLQQVEKRCGCAPAGPLQAFPGADEVVHSILRRVFRPHSPFDRELKPVVLGQLYERFLGVELIPGKRKTDSAARRVGGVYYTPQPVIENIVQQTLGPALMGKSPRDRRKLRIVDPSCGGGAFLLGALDFLFVWSLEWYIGHDPEGWASRKNPPLYKDGPIWRLTLKERARLARDHIYGVDLDPGAIAVAKRALTLKVLEGAGLQRLPLNWSGNLKRGNALVEPDFYDGAEERNASLSSEQRDVVGAFDWAAEFGAGGFDVVIGNPPYANHSSRDSQRAKYERGGQAAQLECFDLCREYCVQRYSHCSAGHHDSYKWFVARALELTKRGGYLGFIIPNTWLNQSKYADLKRCICDAVGDLTVIDLGGGVFPVVVPTCLLIARKGRGRTKRYADLKHERDKWSALAAAPFEPMARDGSRAGHALARKFIVEWPASYKMKAWVTLREGLHIQRVQLASEPLAGSLPVIDSKNMGRYSFDWQPQLFFANAPGPGAFRATAGPRLIVRK
ncbi:hypothetical protein EON80_08470, partial [bacterium]